MCTYKIFDVIKGKEWCWNTHATYCTHALRFVAIGEGALNAAKKYPSEVRRTQNGHGIYSFEKYFTDSAFRYSCYPLAAVALPFVTAMLHYACAYVYTRMQIWIDVSILLT